ncbi:MAG: ribosome silencing factor [bacterium]
MQKKDSEKQPVELARELARIISDKKGEDIIIFDLRDISPITDFFVIATGLSDIHNKTLANCLSEYERPDHIEGVEEGGWILLDYIDVIVHIFSKEAREFYGLERLWGDAPQVKI